MGGTTWLRELPRARRGKVKSWVRRARVRRGFRTIGLRDALCLSPLSAIERPNRRSWHQRASCRALDAFCRIWRPYARNKGTRAEDTRQPRSSSSSLAAEHQRAQEDLRITQQDDGIT
ncbi:hypothetical protein WOLCODRAFT_156795 [Wolfiporia cocos MD-104 SS10]|uniref:Uncharacterized protein n=1 Tax=Wolfiporia cocos (strain MD-104) TaxID=742152 RepID=A0A2H3J1E0_WOLCO|nr:hypothetical protein WOLCODRAFT_156795 [Wolfiporia cocos MD-104 SS10]